MPGKSHGWRSLVGCSPWGYEESDTTERLHFHFSLSCIGEGNGIPFQCSCLENPRDGGAWWAAVSRVAQSRTRWKQLSSSSSSKTSGRKHRRGKLLHMVERACGETPGIGDQRELVFRDIPPEKLARYPEVRTASALMDGTGPGDLPL